MRCGEVSTCAFFAAYVYLAVPSELADEVWRMFPEIRFQSYFKQHCVSAFANKQVVLILI